MNYIGWMTGHQATMSNGEVWRSDPGYALLFVLLRLGPDKEIHFTAANASISCSSKAIAACGVAVSLDDSFRCADGQKSPMLLPTKELHWRQDSGSCYAIVFSVWHEDVPQTISIDGAGFAAGAMLGREGTDGQIGGPTGTQGMALSSTTLSRAIPFAHRRGPSVPMTGLRPPRPADGVVLIASIAQVSVVLTRIPGELLAGGKTIGIDGLCAKLRDGRTCAPLGLVVPILGQGLPYGYMDKFQIGIDSLSLPPGANLIALHDYAGPYSWCTAQECKLALAFPAEVTWENLSSICMPGYESQFLDGTLVLDL